MYLDKFVISKINALTVSQDHLVRKWLIEVFHLFIIDSVKPNPSKIDWIKNFLNKKMKDKPFPGPTSYYRILKMLKFYFSKKNITNSI